MLATNVLPRNGQFKLKRPLITTNGFTTDTDPVVETILTEMNKLLNKRVFVLANNDDFKLDFRPSQDQDEGKNAEGKKELAENKKGKQNNGSNLMELLRLPLENKLAGESHKNENQWPDKSLMHRLYTESSSADKLTLAECIDKTGELASIRYGFGNKITNSWTTLDFNTKTVLSFEGITDYLIAYAYFVRSIEDINGIVNFVLSSGSGARKFVNYGIVSAARYYINQERVNVNYNRDSDAVIQNILSANLSLTSTFKKNVDRLVDLFIHSDTELDLIKKANIGPIPPDIIPQLISYLKAFNKPVVLINEDNIDHYLPLFITQIRGAQQPSAQEEETDFDSQGDFDIERFVDDQSTIQISASNVECAAQLFYSMTLGDELDIFNVVNYFTHKYMVRGNIQIQDKRLRDDLQLYVFSNRFVDIKTNKTLDRTRMPERQMFYKQVFNYGNAQTTEDIVVNKDFQKLWRILITQSANYLERAQDSPNPDMYVSRQTVMQAVEDLQYNLSTHCTGMANVITPIIYKELHFVVKRIFMHPEIMRQIVPAGGSWWRVVETIYSEMKQVKPKTTVLNNKANLGYDIIKSIATYNPSTFEEDSEFSTFISNVDAYIITQAQLQDDDNEQRQTMNGQERNTAPDYDEEPPATPSGNGANKNDEWDF